MINLPGELSIRTIQGSRGAFNVGRLATSIGEFVIKEALLDQYEEGKYRGDFVITQIKPSTYTTSGRLVVEIRAWLESMSLEDVDDLTDADNARLAPHEVDPLDEEALLLPLKADEVKTNPKLPAQPIPEPCSGQSQGDSELFTTVWPLGSSVKLDPTVSRQLLRDQCRRLDQLGYKHDYKTQLWVLPERASTF